MIASALESEVADYVERFAGEVDEESGRLVVRNGRARERKLTIGSGTVAIRAPRVNDKRVDPESGERQMFSSRILPAYGRRSSKVSDVLAVLYLHGLSTSDVRSRAAGPARRGRGGPVVGLDHPADEGLAGPSMSSSGRAASVSTATPTCSSMACMSRCAWARTISCACWW